MGEVQRLRFLVARDGAEATFEWAGSTLRTYRGVVLQRRMTMYRRRLVESYLALKCFRAGYRRGVPIQDLLDRIERWESTIAPRRE